MKAKNSILFFLILILSTIAFGQKKVTLDKKTDIWSGTYKIVPFSKDSIKKYQIQHFVIEKIKDANPDDVAGRYQADLLRWTIKLETQPDSDKEEVRRFFYNDEDNGYEEFGWTDLHKKDKMHCIDGGNFFICKTDANRDVTFGDEILHTETGIFGILLHHGPFQLQKTAK